MTKEDIKKELLAIGISAAIKEIDYNKSMKMIENCLIDYEKQLLIQRVVWQREQLPYDYSKDIRDCPDCKILPGLCALHDK